MQPSTPFVDAEAGTLRLGQIKRESYRVAGLVALFGGVALVPFLFAIALDSLGFLFLLVTQFVLAVGTVVVLIYAVARGVQLAGTSPDARTEPVRE